ncbi:MAG: class I SAM-dependent methyltransferase [Verrucomicrobiota bacterium]
MGETPHNRFQDFFEEGHYLALKNHLYNYLLRKRAVEKTLDPPPEGLVLEIGSGISPVMTRARRIVYSDLSWDALAVLRQAQPRAGHVVADGTRLPFSSGSAECVISSEVLEHVENDRQAIAEIARVLAPGGAFVVTFPHRQFYFAADDRFVRHYRRYELSDMLERLEAAGLQPVHVRKVLGPLEKLTMFSIVSAFALVQKLGLGAGGRQSSGFIRFAAPIFRLANRLFSVVARFDAWLMPRALATVLLVKARKQ